MYIYLVLLAIWSQCGWKLLDDWDNDCGDDCTNDFGEDCANGCGYDCANDCGKLSELLWFCRFSLLRVIICFEAQLANWHWMGQTWKTWNSSDIQNRYPVWNLNFITMKHYNDHGDHLMITNWSLSLEFVISL